MTSKKLLLTFLILLIITVILTIIVNLNNKSFDNEVKTNMEDKMNIWINNKKYKLKLENNETVTQILNMLPLELEMNELNGNEKYVYLDTHIKANPKNVGKIEKGDVMLYGDNCLVIFYKSFDTKYSYTKIGHIDALDTLNSENIKVKLEKN